MIDEATANGAIDDPIVRQRLAQLLHRRSRSCGSTACARSPRRCTSKQGPRRRRARRHQQDVLVRDAPASDGAGARHLRRRTAMLVDGRPDGGLVARASGASAAATATRSAR